MKTFLLVIVSLCFALSVAALSTPRKTQAIAGARPTTIMGTIQEDGDKLRFVTDQRASPNWSRPTRTVQTKETITTISATEIAGRSQRVDYAPLHQNPPSCPVPAAENRDFSLTSDKDQASK
jgi:hypothetical protein